MIGWAGSLPLVTGGKQDGFVGVQKSVSDQRIALN
jgi:hypothetical protein